MIKGLVRKICSSYKIPYFTFSPTFSVCPSHGYLNGNQPVCPTCSEVTEVYSRVVGYLRPIAQWNNGKKEEFKERKMFAVKKEQALEPILQDTIFRMGKTSVHQGAAPLSKEPDKAELGIQ